MDTPDSHTNISPTPQYHRYVIQKELGKGGMGVVYSAYDRLTQTHVARNLIEIRADYARAEIIIQRGLSLLPPADSRIATLSLLYSEIYVRSSNLTQAKDWATRALDFAQAHGFKNQLGESLYVLGKLERDAGEYRAAHEYFQKSLAVYQDIPDLAGIADAQNGLGLIANEEGDYAAAQTYYQQSLSSSESADYLVGISRAFNNLGRIAEAQGDNHKALDYFQQALEIWRTFGDKWRTTLVLNNISVMLLRVGRGEEARKTLQEALKLSDEIGDKRWIAHTLLNLGENAQVQGQDDVANDYFMRCSVLYREINDSFGLALTLELMVISQLNQGTYAVLETLRESLQTSLSLKSPPRILTTILLWTEWLAMCGEAVRATELVALVDGHPAIEAEIRAKRVPKLKTDLQAVLTVDEFNTAWSRGAALDIYAAAQTLLNDNDAV